ncbi:hypothetical protein [Natronorubrum daqingense]|uniref:Uncharacterized protein n=1 Tax=Natronorubrum daqingense TaxID=588898 RepID=A0A1N7FZE3_9EURY|nr:hypothetical protein [Natronorubrum daqingense]APX98587.1 hypothetical protein BB347_17970 [Natronorubrum daqingense]SIS05722.1 hypothetical protein SAMN05421809_3607 [Natronorubrum daqingense]
MSTHSEVPQNGQNETESKQLSSECRIERRQRDISETITELEEVAMNEQVEALADLLRLMDTELKRLEARNRLLTNRLQKVEVVNGLSGDEIDLGDVSALDHRDQKVVKAIVADGRELLSLGDLRELYRNHTDVRSSETLKGRTKALTSSNLFERERSGPHTSAWRFTGPSD